MKRRDFLFLTDHDGRVVELSCEQLYMQFNDVSGGSRIGSPEQGSLDGADWWAGEPPAEMPQSRLDELFQTLEKRLEQVDVLRVSNRDWLKDDVFKARVYGLLTEFQSRGARWSIPATR